MTATTQFSVVYGKVQSGLGDTTAETLVKIKLAVNQAYRYIGSQIYGITISADLSNATDVIAIDDSWIYVLVQGSFAHYYTLWDDSRADVQMKLFLDLVKEMEKGYGTRAGTFGTFGQLWTDLASDLGMWSKVGVGKIKGALNDAISEILSYEDWTFNKVRDAIAIGDGGYEYTLNVGCWKPINIRVGDDRNVTALEKKDPQWVDYSIEMRGTIPYTSSRPTHWCENGFATTGAIKIKINAPIPTGVLIYYDYVKKITPLTADADVCPVPKEFLHTLKTVAMPYLTGTIKDMQAATTALKQMRMQDFKNEDNDVAFLRGRSNVK